MNGSLKYLGGGVEEAILHNVTVMLSGVPPPPSLSVCSLSCNQLLEAIYNNSHLNALPVEEPKHFVKEETPKMFYLNSGQVSEDLADMFVKLQRRLVQSETLSTFSVRPAPPARFAPGRLKGTSSPGRRLSHLARRRQVFSIDNLRHLAHNEPKNLLTITRNNVDQNIPKRALFQSPDDPNVQRGLRTVKRPAIAVPRRRLFNDAEKNKSETQFSFSKEGYDVSTWLASQSFGGGRKRSRQEEKSVGNGSKRKCPRRSLDFSPPASQTSEASHPSTDKTPNPPLTHIQKQKLLWAVSVALKEQGISHQHEYFKRCASVLFNQSKKQLPTILSSSGTSTSEKMLAFTRDKVSQVVASIVPEHVLITPKLITETRDDKENQHSTPKRPIRNRGWKTCLKNVRKRNARLKRSVSLTDLSSLMLNQQEGKFNWKSFKENYLVEIQPTTCKVTDSQVNESVIGEEINFSIMDDSHVMNETIATQDMNLSSFTDTSNVIRNAPSPDLFEDSTYPLVEASQLEDVDESAIVRFPMLSKISDSKKSKSPLNTTDTLEPKESTEILEKEEKLSISEAASEKSDRLLLTCKRRNSWHSEPGPGLTLKMRLAQEWAVVNSISENGSGTPSSCSSLGSYTLMELRDRLAIERTLQADSSDISWYSSNQESTDEVSGAESTFNYTLPSNSKGEEMAVNETSI